MILPGITYVSVSTYSFCVFISDVNDGYSANEPSDHSAAVLLAGCRLGARPPANHLRNETEMIGEGSIPPSAANRDLRGVLE